MKPQEINDKLLAVDTLHHACRYLASQFSLKMSRDEAQQNVDARVMLTNMQNYLMDEAYELSGLTEAGGLVELRVVRRIKHRCAAGGNRQEPPR